jgi:hypothetical protein
MAGEWAAAGKGRRAVGPLGQKVRLFFSFSFPNLFQYNSFSNQIQTKILQTFHKIL